MALSNLSVINNDISEFFGGINDVLSYISQQELEYISLFKGSFVTANSWDLNIDLTIFDILPNSYITVLDNNNNFSYTRPLTDSVFGLDPLDTELIFQTPHANYITIIFKKSYQNVITDSYLLVWLSHKLKDSDLSKLISHSLSNNIETPKVQDKNEIYLNNYYLNNGDVYYKYVPGVVSVNNDFNQVFDKGEESIFNLTDRLIYPKNGWYIFYQKSGTNVYPLDLFNLVGLGFRRLRFNKSGSIFINTSNLYLQTDVPISNNITSDSVGDSLTTDRFIRLEGFFVYRNPTLCNNVNFATAIGSINIFDIECEDVLTIAILGSNNLTSTDFLESEIFLNQDSFFSECTSSVLSNPTQIGFCNNRNIAVAGFNVNSEASSTTVNKNNTISFGRLVVYFSANTININISVLNTYIIIGNITNNNISTAQGNRGILSSYGSINNTNTSNAISTLPFFSGNTFITNRNTSTASFTFIKGLIATCINRQITSASVQRYVISGGTIFNTNVSVASSFGSVPSAFGVSNHFNITTAEGLSGQELSSTITNINTTSAELIISYQGYITNINRNISTASSSIRYLAPISNTTNNNSFVIIV
jgi:hypothetical protein